MSSSVEPIRVEVRGTPGNYSLFRGGMPYTVRGAGIDVAESDATELIRTLHRYGGNSFRTWNVGDGAFLDLAHELGMTVALCLDIKRERHGFDYGDRAAVAAQFERAKATVLRHRNHPALLVWVIGNELNHDYSDPRVYDAVNDISRMIHELDPNHPTTTTTADINADLAAVLDARAPDLDFISVQVYGALFTLPQRLQSLAMTRALMVTEWGTIGHWEVPTTSWGAPLEQHSSDKAATYRRGYSEVLAPLGGMLIGDYAFLWGEKQERTPTWYGVFVNGRPTAAVGVLEGIWRGRTALSRAPAIRELILDGRTAGEGVKLLPGRAAEAEVRLSVSAEASLRFNWRLLLESDAQQSGGDREVIPTELAGHFDDATGRRVSMQVPQRPGAYRLFVYVDEAGGGVAHANFPFFVDSGGR